MEHPVRIKLTNNCCFIQAQSAIYIKVGAHGVTVSIIKNRLSYRSSNSEQGCLYFT